MVTFAEIKFLAVMTTLQDARFVQQIVSPPEKTRLYRFVGVSQYEAIYTLVANK